MLEAEISLSGDVLIKGHHVGQVEGFRFTPNMYSSEFDIQTVKAAVQKELTIEFGRRVERFCASANSDFALGSDGVLRWIGTPVATLVASEDILRPHIVLLADEQLAGSVRDKVAARLERFMLYHLRMNLKPLYDLSDKKGLTDPTQGIALQLIKNFGVLHRRDVAAHVRSLDQDSRAALRRIGVRIGTFHVFIPSLFKPASAEMSTLLWALKENARERPGYGDVINVLSVGRTSTVVDPSFDPIFYRLAGYRILGRLAVRIDILERLADMIWSALAWRPGVGRRPDGAYDGQHFIVTSTMMSILGATAEDMEGVLKDLGYRHEIAEAASVSAKLAAFDVLSEANHLVDTLPGEKADAHSAETLVKPQIELFIENIAPHSSVTEEIPKSVFLWYQNRSKGHKRQPNQINTRSHDHGNDTTRVVDDQNTSDSKFYEKKAGDHSRKSQSKTFYDKHGYDKRGEQNTKALKKKHPKHHHFVVKDGSRVQEHSDRSTKIDPDSPFAKLIVLKEQMQK